MSKGRFTLLSLFGAVTFAAVGCAAMVQPSLVWTSAIWTVVITLLTGAAIRCFYTADRRRAFYIGFSVFGWGHMILAIRHGLSLIVAEFC
jgi:hypothetical protein